MAIAGVDVINQIGETAGKIFRALEVKKEQTLADLRKAIKIENGELLNQGIGWLARESKINVNTNLRGELRFSLRQ